MSLPDPGSGVFRFGPYEADARSRELRKHGLRVQLQDKSFGLLVSLLEHDGELVGREELVKSLWPEGVFVNFQNSLNSAVNRLRDALRDRARRPRYIETLVGRGYRFIARVERARAVEHTLAVLPFENLNHDPEQDFLADAVSDALRMELGNVTSLRVISRQSVLRLKDTRKTLPAIADELKADVVVEGSVLLVGRSVRIAAQLVHPAPEQQLWSKAYQCEMADLQTVQGQVVRDMALAVQVTLSPAEQTLLCRPRPVDPQAHVAYLKACHHMDKNSREGFQKSFQYLQMALERDPSHAPALARLAEYYSLLGFWGHMPTSDSYRRAKELALRATVLDPGLSIAHWVLGWVSWLCDWDLGKCETEIHRAIQLNPSDEGARVMHAVLLAVVRGDPKAIEEARLALELDPLSLDVNTAVAWIHLFLKDYDAALQQARAALDLFPDSLHAYYIIGCAHLGSSRFEQAIEAFEKAYAISGDAFSIAYLGHAYARAGQMEAAISLRDTVLAMLRREYVSPRALLCLYAGLGERDLAFELLEKAYQDHDSLPFWLCACPTCQPLRSDPRFDEMVHRIGMPIH
ncbi:MAG: winged helix-turn-helix domain-containing tetratricopeptide repeat protein [Bryobacteraceae bacterium]